MSQLDNAFTFALGGGRAWFTESTGNAIGFVNASYGCLLAISADGNPPFPSKGENSSLRVDLRGNSSSPISIQVSDVVAEPFGHEFQDGSRQKRD